MPTISRDALNAYSEAVGLAQSGAESDMRAALAAYRDANPDATIEEIRDYATGALESVVDTYGDAAASAALDFAEGTLGEVGVSVPYAGVDYPEQLSSMAATSRYQVGKVTKGDWEGFVDQMCRAARNYVGAAANSQTMASVERHASDPKSWRSANGRPAPRVRWARVPMGPETCNFCMMLASRGFVYWSDESAGANGHFHRGCDCKVVEGVDGLSVEGYDPDKYYDVWREFERIDADPDIKHAEKLKAKEELIEDLGQVPHHERMIQAGYTSTSSGPGRGGAKASAEAVSGAIEAMDLAKDEAEMRRISDRIMGQQGRYTSAQLDLLRQAATRNIKRVRSASQNR